MDISHSSIRFLGVDVDNVTYDEVLASVESSLMKNEGLCHIVTVGPEFLLKARNNETFRNVLNTAELAVPDGVGLRLAGLLRGHYLRQRVTGIDLVERIAAYAAEHGKSLFLLGGVPGRAQKAGEVLRSRYPNLHIAGAETFPVLSKQEWNDENPGSAVSKATNTVLEKICSSGANILFVAFGAPKQDLWIAKNRIKLPSVRLAMGVGGAFDMLSGALRRAPGWMQKLGLEWLWRALLQPKRIGRILNATVRFPLSVLFDRS